MKRIFLISAVLLSLGAMAQNKIVAKAYPALSNPNITGVNGEAVDANFLLKNGVVRFNISIINPDQKELIKAGTCVLQIELGANIRLANKADLLNMPLRNYFLWSLEKDNKGKSILTGKLIDDIPTDFFGSTFINVQCMDTGNSSIKAFWISADKNKKSAFNAVDFTIVKNKQKN